MAATTWRNWSGSVAAHPRTSHYPRSEDELAALVRRLRQRSGSARIVGTGHSSTGIVEAQDALISLRQYKGVVSVDRTRRRATVRAGTPLSDLGEALYAHDLALPNLGDVATQTIGGAVGTGTHGTGQRLQNLSQMMIAVRLIDGDGNLHEIGTNEPHKLHALRVSLGMLGIFTDITLQLVPSFDIERREYAAATDDVLKDCERLIAENRSFDFYWYPRRDDCKIRLLNPPGGGTFDLPYARLLEWHGGYGHQVIPTHSGIPHHFEECEYAVPAEHGIACFQAVRERVLMSWRSIVGWRVLFRTVADDDSDLSPAHGRGVVTLSLHQNSSLPWRDYFRDIEPIFLAYQGRPHWAKKHGLHARDLAPRYPRWDHFLRMRERFDPAGTFLNRHLRDLMGVTST